METPTSIQHDTILSLDHNNRKNPEPHIDPHGKHEIWISENVRDLLEEHLHPVIDAYNVKQSRKDRKIDFAEFVKKNRKSCVNELIVMVGDRDTKPNEKTAYIILKEYFESWTERNPNLILVNVAYHADELGTKVDGQDNRGGYHIHLDYIPISDSYVNGPAKQICETRAYNDLGFHTGRDANGKFSYARAKFLANERRILDDICRKHGLEVTPKKEAHEKHMKIQDYKQKKLLENQDKAIAEKESKLFELDQKMSYLKTTYDEIFGNYEKVAKNVEKKMQNITAEEITITTQEYERMTHAASLGRSLKSQLKAKEEEIEELERTVIDLNSKVTKVERKLEKAEQYKDDVEEYLREQTLENGRNALKLFRKWMKDREAVRNPKHSTDDISH